MNAQGSWLRVEVIVALAVVVAATATPLRADVSYRESVRSYELGGSVRTRSEVWKRIRKDGGIGTTLTNAIGSAAWKVSPQWYWRRSPGGRCTINRVTVAVDVLLRVPDWHFAHRARRRVRRYFSCVRDAILVHERRHGEIAKEIGHAVHSALLEEVRNVACRRLREIATSVYNRELDHGRRRQKAFDRADRERGHFRRCVRLTDPPRVTMQDTSSAKPASQPRRKPATHSARRSPETPLPQTTPDASKPDPKEPEVPWDRLVIVAVLGVGLAWFVKSNMGSRY